LGYVFQAGQGVPRDYKTALKWYRLSAEQGFSDAYNNLDAMYEKGLGVPQDYKIAVKWYGLAAEAGHYFGQHNFGTLYEDGKGVPQDNVYAHMWYNLAASSGLDSLTKNKDRLSIRMSPSQLETAQNLARECVRKKYKGC
jgi:TPR repeat protein